MTRRAPRAARFRRTAPPFPAPFPVHFAPRAVRRSSHRPHTPFGAELELETGDARMPRSRPLKRLSDGELAELRAQLIDLLDRSWIQHSTAGHAVSVVFARKPDGSWRICYDCRGLNAITRPAGEPLPHVDALLDGGSRWSSKLGPASSYHQLRVQAADRWNRGRRAPGRSWASSSGTWHLSVCRADAPPRC